jgi:5'-AMP-activated protein kinase catalytic alpha subunit
VSFYTQCFAVIFEFPLFYLCPIGYLPFDDQDTQVLYKKIMNGDFSIPNHVSPEGRDMLKCILTTNPNTRYTIPEIRRHPWYNVYKNDGGEPPQGIIVGYHKIPVDNKILMQVSNYGYEPELVRKHLEANKHNRMTTL